MTAEERLSAFLQEGRGPARDPAFDAEVMQRVARREFARTLAMAGGAAAVGAAALWACAPALRVLLEPAASALAPVAAILAVTAGVILFGQSVLRRS